MSVVYYYSAFWRGVYLYLATLIMAGFSGRLGYGVSEREMSGQAGRDLRYVVVVFVGAELS